MMKYVPSILNPGEYYLLWEEGFLGFSYGLQFTLLLAMMPKSWLVSFIICAQIVVFFSSFKAGMYDTISPQTVVFSPKQEKFLLWEL